MESLFYIFTCITLLVTIFSITSRAHLLINLMEGSTMKYCLTLVFMMIFFMSCSIIDKDAQKLFSNRTGPFEVTVYPVHVVISETTFADTSLQKELVQFLNDSGLAKAVASGKDVDIPFQWRANQAKMYRRSAQAFAAAVALDKPATSYALLIETLSMGAENNMGGVHFYLVDTTGKVVAGTLSNSHWEEFKSISPQDRKAGMQVAFSLLKTFTIETS